jgi:heme A synthase
MTRFAKYAWGVLLYNVAVIIWGTYVRATGSGAACGAHWPLCNGEVIPLAPQTATLVEFSHRLMSGLALILVITLTVWAFRTFPRRHLTRIGSTWSLLFIISEALVGAGLVLFKLAGENTSIMRAFATSLHLVNTFLLLAALTLTAWWASRPSVFHWRFDRRGWLFLFGMIGMLVVGASGAIAALGDALFPSTSLAQGIALDLSSTAHLFLRLRIFHPVIAIGVGLYLIILAASFGLTRQSTKGFAVGLIVLIVVQWIAGVVNVVLLAPVWMQMLHLLIADVLWIVFILMIATACGHAVTVVEAVDSSPLPLPVK